MQTPLFEAPLVPGLEYQPRFVSQTMEQALLREFARLDFQPFQFQGWEGKRRTVSFGWSYDFSDSRLKPAPAMPDWLLGLRGRAAQLAGVVPEDFAHALVVEYAPGAGIGWHRDRPAFDVVCGISLVAPCTLRFRRRRGKRFERAALLLEPCSAYVLTGPARHEWEHSIAPMATLRYSVTFRSLRD
jgi:alkylated DNA repair protein (DNA oxidative demethylase)